MVCVTVKRTAKAKDQHPPPQLSCKLCREKKLKCDKQAPCENCKSIGAECNTVFRHRLPRGRHARHKSSGETLAFRSTTRPASPNQDSTSEQGIHNQESNKRLRRSESLVAERTPDELSEFNFNLMEESRSDDCSSSLCSSDPPRGNTEKHMVSDNCVDINWSDTAGNVSELVHNAGPQNAGLGLSFKNFSQQRSPVNLNDYSSALNLWNSKPTALRPHSVGESSLVRSTTREICLCDIYLRQVDPIIKVLHRPTVDRWLRRGQPYLHYPQGHASTEALAWAVCYSTVCSMTEEQCQMLIQQSRSAAVVAYQRACENALDRAGYLTTEDIVVIQAFVLYLIGRRVDDKSLATWTLTSVLVRIATAQDIQEETKEKETFFDQQIRMRLWLTICWIDFQASVAQSTRPMITVEDVRPALSKIKNLNDDDLSKEPADNNTMQDREELTDVTLALIWFHLQVTGRLLHDPVPGSQSRTQLDSLASHDTDHKWREQQAREFQRTALGLLSFCDMETSPYAWFTWHSAQYLVSSVRISAVRPNTSVFSSNPTFLSRSKIHSDLFERTIGVLKKALQTQSDPRAEGFRWHVAVPWTEIAIATSECLACHDPRIVCRVWPTIEAAFQLYESRTAQSKTSRTLARRMQQVQQIQQRWARAAGVPSLEQAACQCENTSSLHTVGQAGLPLLASNSVPMDNSSDPASWTGATTPSSTDWSLLYSLPDDTAFQSVTSTSSELVLLPDTPMIWGGKESVAENGSQEAMNIWGSSSVNASSFDDMDIAADDLYANREILGLL
ncbi:hypothetical protein BGZ60DRAFT_497029 [Tricladium varicosporioides]|nr:hypothetical protein BGZ60DRAFT_497029 [Hymenoscyphus varicosporioides]